MQAKRGTSLNFPVFQARRRIAITVLSVFLLDDLTKTLALRNLPDHPIRLLGDFLKLDLRYNSGAAFNIAASHTIFLSSLAIGVSGALLYFSLKVTNLYWALAIGMAIGGIFGNLSDRFFRPPGGLSGQVVDWIELAHWPTFNLADASIVISALILVILSIQKINPIAPDLAN
jgi:signal peptidase II